MRTTFLGWIAILCSGVAVAHGGLTASFQGLGHLPTDGSIGSFAEGVSPDGLVVVGHSHVEDALGNTSSAAFVWTEATGMVELPGGALACLAYGTSSDGSVIVGQNFNVGQGVAFRWSGGGIVNLGTLGGNNSHAEACSGDGAVVVGRSYTASRGEAFRWTQATSMVGLGTLGGHGSEDYSIAFDVSADGSVIVGGSYSPSGFEAFRWTQPTGMVGLGDVPGGDFHSYFRGVSLDGQVAVGFSYTAFGGEAVRWTEETGMVGLVGNPSGPNYSDAFAVSANGSIVVGYARNGASGDANRAFIWDPVHGMRDLRDLLVGYGLDLDGWTLKEARDISADGQTIVGFGRNPDGRLEAWIATIPEPATLALLALGGLLLIRNRAAVG